MCLAAYAGALTNLAAQAAERQVTPEDRQLLDSLLLADHGAAVGSTPRERPGLTTR